MLKKSLAIVFIISILLLVFSGCMLSQDELLQKATSEVKNNDFSKMQSHISNMKPETLEQFKIELDKTLDSVLKARDYKKAEILLNNLKEVATLSEYLNYKQGEIIGLQTTEDVYKKANQIYNSLSSITDETEKNSKIKECYKKFISIEDSYKKYFADLSHKIAELKLVYEKNIAKESIELAKQLADKKDYNGAILALNSSLKESEYKKEEILSLKQKYEIDFKDYIESQINVIELNNNDMKYISKDAEPNNNFTFYTYLLKRNNFSTYDIKFVVGITQETVKDFERIEIPNGANRRYIFKASDKHATKLDSEDTYQLTINYYVDEFLKNMLTNNKEITVEFIYGEESELYTVSAKQIKAIKDTLSFFEINNNK